MLRADACVSVCVWFYYGFPLCNPDVSLCFMYEPSSFCFLDHVALDNEIVILMSPIWLNKGLINTRMKVLWLTAT